MFESKLTFRAAQIAAALGISPKAVRDQLDGIDPAGKELVSGNEAKLYLLEQLPPRMRERLAVESGRQKCTMEVLLSLPRRQWQPPIAVSNICQSCFDQANLLREALKPFLTTPPDPGLSAEEWKQRGVDYYFRVFKIRITTHHWDRLIRRTEKRDNGVENFDALTIYLPERLKRKAVAAVAAPAEPADDLVGLANFICAIKTPGKPDKEEIHGLWALATQTYQMLVQGGELEKRAARRVRQFLFERASFLAASKDALWVAFKRKLAALDNSSGDLQALGDGRINNGPQVEIPQADIDLLTQSAALKNGGRIDAAWREEYPLLSKTVRRRYTDSFRAPAKIHELLCREKIDALDARHQGKRKLRRMVGGVKRDWTGVPSMHSWVVDDWTSNVECAFTNPDGSISLIKPQIIAVMDSASRKFVGWTISPVKAPNAGIVCDAVLDGIKTHGVPKRLGVENGFVFGKSALVNGREDDQGRTLVAGLGQFGCHVHHFEKMDPQSKSELEYGFHQLQCLQERFPGYGGRLEMLDAPEDFKFEKRLIEAGKMTATDARMTYAEFIVETNGIILQYNATKQGQGSRLKGLSPDEAFAAGMDINDPPIKFTPKLLWLLHERELVTVKVGGVSFIHRSTRQQIRVSGGKLADFKMIGEQIWAVMDRRDASMVTFMDQKFTDVFTMEVCHEVSARQADVDPGADTLEKERAKKRQHEASINEKYNQLKTQLGNPRRDLLKKIRGETNALANVPNETTRRTIINSRIETSGEKMEQQRAALTAAKEQKITRTAANKSKARRDGIPTVMVDDDEQSRRALELLSAGSRGVIEKISTEGNEV